VLYKNLRLKIKESGKKIDNTDDEDEILDLGSQTVEHCSNALVNI